MRLRTAIYGGTSVLGAALAIFMAVNVGQMAFWGGLGTLDGHLSPTLISVFVMACLVGLYSLFDIVQVYRGVCSKRGEDGEIFTWTWEHDNFKRAVIPLAFQTLTVWPSVLTFLAHSTGNQFFDVAFEDSHDLEELFVFLIVSGVCLLLTCIIQFFIQRKVLRDGYFDLIARKSHIESATATRPQFLRHMNCTIAVCKLNLIANTVFMICFCVALLRASMEHSNSGMVIISSLYILMALVTLMYNFAAFFRFRSRPKKWWIAYRGVFAVQLFFAYIAYWINMTQLVVVVTTPQYNGYFEAVSNLPGSRSTIVYGHMWAFVALVVIVAIRVYFAKLRKKGRQDNLLRPLFALIPGTHAHEEDQQAQPQQQDAKESKVALLDVDEDGNTVQEEAESNA